MSDTTQSYENLGPTSGAKFRQRTLPFLIAIAVLLAIPMTDPSRTVLTLIHQMAINIVFALAYNMLLGRGGMLSFGHAVYFGLGGYYCMHAMNWIEEGAGIWAYIPTFFLPILGFIGGGLAAAVIGSFSTRRSGTTFAMISLGVAELVFSGAFMFDSLFGGEQGINGDRMNGPEVFGLSMGPMSDIYWFMTFWVVVSVIAMYAFTRTPLGRLSEATRDNPQRVEFIGYNPTRVRWLVFTISGGFAGLAGGMSAVNYEIFTPEALSLIPSGFVLIMAYVGGITYFAGPIMGAIVLTYMSSMLSDFTEAWLLYLGLMFVLIVMYAPRGIAGIVFGFWDGVRGANSAELLRKWAVQVAGGLLMLIGLIVLVEVAIRWSNGWGEAYEPFGLHFMYNDLVTWIVIAVPLVIGGYLMRLATREKEETLA
ncbi:branched-chain amino acid ABC transporter permease [Pseudooceanicola sp. MF1-13]|uniref:branched-chain amino acid ABC transporter permease n=1 Tax=Pseudooceanicola sp. MF1-13 TaxID=3379095 RepID=UPI00389146F7